MRCLRGTLAAADSRAMLISCHLKGMSDKWKHPRHRPHPLKLVSRIFTQFISLRDVEERISEINIEDEIGKFKRNAPHLWASLLPRRSLPIQDPPRSQFIEPESDYPEEKLESRALTSQDIPSISRDLNEVLIRFASPKMLYKIKKYIHQREGSYQSSVPAGELCGRNLQQGISQDRFPTLTKRSHFHLKPPLPPTLAGCMASPLGG